LLQRFSGDCLILKYRMLKAMFARHERCLSAVFCYV
jgi:hypothetical protein